MTELLKISDYIPLQNSEELQKMENYCSGWFRRFSQKKPAVFGCLTNALAPPPIALESCSTAQTDRPV